MRISKCLAIVLIGVLLLTAFSGSYAQTGTHDDISIIIPQRAIINFIRAALPLNLENGPYLKGNIWIQSIDQVKLGSNKIAFEMMVQGRNLKIETRLGKKVMLFDIGNLNSAFSCEASFRYDAHGRILYITPNILQKTTGNDADQFAANLLQMLSLANGTEYPLEIRKIQPVVTKIGGDFFNIVTDITHISTEKDAVFIRGRILPQKTGG